MSFHLPLAPFGMLLLLTPLAASDSNDREGVKQAVLDYLEGVYNVDPSRIERSVHPELAKRGFSRRDASMPYREGRMTFEQLKQVAATWNKEGKSVKADSPREVVILDLSDQTASVRLNAEWGFDYMHLAKYEGKWKIVNVLWQSWPPGAKK